MTQHDISDKHSPEQSILPGLERVDDAAQHQHDPGGKVRLRVATGITGEAWFSECGRYRRLLTREWDGGEGAVLWIGMNPSTAAADVDDPTVRRETDFTRSWGHAKLLKCNVMDYRATKPADLLVEGVEPCTPENLEVIRDQAIKADKIILAFGALHKKLLHHGTDVVEALRKDGHTVFCMGQTKAGLPRHPLYLRKDTLPQIYED